jgi:hypothetical protein
LFPRLILSLVLCGLVLAAASSGDALRGSGLLPQKKWYRGNTHCHTDLCGHADSTPEAVAKWYLDHGYQFVCLSEHNRFIDPAKVRLPPDRRQDFILIPGEEITGPRVHVTALNTSRLVPPTAHPTRTKTVQSYADRTRDAGGVPVINHPNDNWALSPSDLRPVAQCRLFELYNAHPAVRNGGDATHPSTEEMWDALLTDGMVMFGVASDDAHDFRRRRAGKPNPGRGWVMVRAAELTPKAVTEAMDRGDFYASSGVLLKDVTVTNREYRVVVDPAATEAEASKPDLLPRRVPRGRPARPGYAIDFIGPGGIILGSVNGTEATFRRAPGVAYVRANVSYTWRTAGGDTVQCYAWTQPAFDRSGDNIASTGQD